MVETARAKSRTGGSRTRFGVVAGRPRTVGGEGGGCCEDERGGAEHGGQPLRFLPKSVPRRLMPLRSGPRARARATLLRAIQ